MPLLYSIGVVVYIVRADLFAGMWGHKVLFGPYLGPCGRTPIWVFLVCSFVLECLLVAWGTHIVTPNVLGVLDAAILGLVMGVGLLGHAMA